MYRASLERQKMEEEQGQFLHRVGSLPVVTTALGQLGCLYSHTKEKNRLFKFALETTESGVKIVANTAAPVVNKLDKPIGSLNHFACNQLDKLEESYPIITQPTEKVMAETRHLYDTTLKPTVDRVTAIKDLGSEKITNVTNYTSEKLDGVKQLTVSTVGGVKHLTVSTVDGVMRFTVSTVDGVRRYSVSKLEGLCNYSTEKLGLALETEYGKALTTKLDQLLDLTDNYVDHYLPEQKGEESVKSLSESDNKATTGSTTTLTRATNIGSKLSRRAYSRALKDLSNLQLRSKDNLDKLSFTVDLIQYCKTNVDNVQDRFTEVGNKALWLWDEITRDEDEEEIEMENLAGDDIESDEEGKNTFDNMTLERRLISTARHLTLSLKRGFHTIADTASVLPETFTAQLNNAKNFTELIYIDFASAKSLDDLKLVDQIRDKLSYMQNTLVLVTDYVTNMAGDWLIPEDFLDGLDLGEDDEWSHYNGLVSHCYVALHPDERHPDQ